MTARPVAPAGSPAARLAGALALVAVFAGIVALVVELRGASPAAFLGIQIGSFLGLVSLVLEIAMVERSSRTFHAQGVQTTFLSFMMRLVVVAPATLLFMKPALGVDHEAFALSYCSTFFLYMCWLTWKTYHAPSTYRPRARAAVPGAPAAIVVLDHRAKSGAAR
jgi:hypothetical protein